MLDFHPDLREHLLLLLRFQNAQIVTILQALEIEELLSKNGCIFFQMCAV